MRMSWILLFALAVTAAWTLGDRLSRAAEEAQVTGELGAARPGLTTGENSKFELGRQVFLRRFTRSEGLGPHFNATSCASCHEDPAPGGSSQRYRDFMLAARDLGNGHIQKIHQDCTEDNRVTHKSKLCLPSMVIPHYGPKGTIDDPVAAEVEHARILPGDDIIVATRNAPPIFGLGFFSLVSDEEILSRADPSDADGDGISGRANRIESEDSAIGRFGYKCQTASIEAFNRGALLNQMGITSNSLELAFAESGSGSSAIDLESWFFKSAYAQVAEPKDRNEDFDDVLDPEISRGELEALVFFQENLAAPKRGPISSAVEAGEIIFAEIGCTSCHTPGLETELGFIYPYSDLLLHDMGPELADGIQMQLATGSEFRTQPLWGLCEHFPFLHDGRADTVSQAILLHGGEAQASRDAYAELDNDDLARLHRFLESL